MSDSKDSKSSQRRRGRSASKQSEEPGSGNTPMDVDPSDKPTDSSEKDASKDKPEKRSAAQPSGSYGGARPKVQSQKKAKESDESDSIRGTIQRAVEVLESTACRRRDEFRENKRLKKVEQNVTRYLGSGWVDTLIQDEPWTPREGSAVDRLRKLARSILISEFERRRSERKEDLRPWIPVAYRLAQPRMPCPLSDVPVECEFDDDFEIEMDSDLFLPLQIKLPDPCKGSPESPKRPKDGDDEPPPDAPSGAEQVEDRLGAGYRGRNIPSYLFAPYSQFSQREQVGGGTSQEAYEGLDEIYERYGVNTWRTYASAAYQTGRYHTEEELRIARERMDDRNISDENYRDWYHSVRRGPLGIDEDTTIEIPELEARLISFLITMEKMTTAMLYIDIFRELERREEEERREEAQRVEREARARMVTDSDHSSDSYPSALASGIVEDYIQERTRLVYERLVDSEAESLGITSKKYPSALASGSSTSSPLEVQSPDVISPGEGSGQKMEVSARSSIHAPSVESRSDPTSEKGLLRSFETTSSSKESSFKTSSSSGEKPGHVKSRVESLEKSESFESTSRSISPIPLDTEMSEEEVNIQVDDPKLGAQANFMGHVAVTGFLQSIEDAILQEEESEMEVQSEPSEEAKSTDSKEQAKEKDELAKRKELRSKDSSETDSKRPHMG